jgi:Ca2+-binding RTX toxin-like protein
MANFYGTDVNNNQTGGFVNYYGGDGNDILLGDANANELYGGQGNDWLAGANYTTFTGTGTAADPYVITGFQPSGADYLEGGSGSDILHGADGNDELYGGAGNESGVVQVQGVNNHFVAGLYGGEGDDYINGGTGNDDLFGEAGDDFMVGSDGEDNLYGGIGEDNMLGGSEADFFIFGADIEELDGDRIGDFDRREDDIIDVSAIDARPGGSDNDFDYIGANRFDAKGQMSFKNGKLKFNLDNDNGAEAVMYVNTNKLTNGDFEL